MSKFCLIIGMGNSGKWAYNLTLSLGYVPIIFDDEFMTIDEIRNSKMNFSFVVVSPSIKKSHSIIKYLTEKGLKIISEIELAYLARDNKNCIIGVTGTNGKTTVVSMIGDILGGNAIVAGNIGIPWSKVLNNEKKYTVLELSSFQLEFIECFTPDIAVFTNLAPDHLEHHSSYEEYVNAKLNLIKNANKNTKIIYFADDDYLSKLILSKNSQNCYYFAINRRPGFGVYIENSEVVVSDRFGETKLFSLSEFNELAYHNKLNLLASTLVAYLCGVEVKNILLGLKNFTFPHFREELIENKLNCKIVNDSKSTNLASTLTALKTYNHKVTLILGGMGKGEDYSALFLKDFGVERIVVYGEVGEKMISTAQGFGYKSITKIDKFDEAVNFALNQLNPGDTLLFSPACSSFDQFVSYQERGRRFNELVKNFQK